MVWTFIRTISHKMVLMRGHATYFYWKKEIVSLNYPCHPSWTWPCPEVKKLFSCSTQLSMKFFLFINVKMPTIVGILTFKSGKNSILGLSEPKKCRISWYFYTYEHLKLSMKKSFITSGPCLTVWQLRYYLDYWHNISIFWLTQWQHLL